MVNQGNSKKMLDFMDLLFYGAVHPSNTCVKNFIPNPMKEVVAIIYCADLNQSNFYSFIRNVFNCEFRNSSTLKTSQDTSSCEIFVKVRFQTERLLKSFY